MLRQRDAINPLDDLVPVVVGGRGRRARSRGRGPCMSLRTIEDYAVALANATRTHPDLRLGASPRATLQLVRAAKVWAALDGRGFVIPDDITALLIPVFAHRLIPTRSAGGARARSRRRRDRGDPRTHRAERARADRRTPVADHRDR